MQKDLTEKEKRDNVDKIKNNQNLEPALIVKLILVLFCLLTAAFVSGVVIGKNGRHSIDRTSSDEEGINEKLSACIFNSDELRGKYLKLRDAAREKGLLDENDLVDARVICKSVETFPETSSQKKPKTVEEAKPTETKPEEKPAEKKVEKNVETSPKEPEKSEKTEKPAESKTIDEILAKKSAGPEKGKGKKCLYSIQIFAADSKEQAEAAAKKLKSLKPRIISSENKGKTWYKLRSGCFDSREAAEAGLPKVKKMEKSAYIVSE